MSRLLEVIKEAKADAIAHHEGKKTLRTFSVKPSKPIAMSKSRVAKVRHNCGMSQAVFARCLHISSRTLEQWEHGTRHPSGASAVLMALLEKHPKLITEFSALR